MFPTPVAVVAACVALRRRAHAGRRCRPHHPRRISLQHRGSPLAGWTQTVSFVSTRGALTIAAFDVDDDHDADLVVTPVLSHEIVGIWVNDGAGHFDAGNSESFASVAGKIGVGPSILGFGHDLIPVVAGRRSYALGLSASVRLPHQPGEFVPVRPSPVPIAAVALALGISPRAPPFFRS